eukprot:4772509-Amphidinium_carterae.1
MAAVTGTRCVCAYGAEVPEQACIPPFGSSRVGVASTQPHFWGLACPTKMPHELASHPLSPTIRDLRVRQKCLT